MNVVINTTLEICTSECGAGCMGMGTMAAESVSQLEFNPNLSHEQFVRGDSTTKLIAVTFELRHQKHCKFRKAVRLDPNPALDAGTKLNFVGLEKLSPKSPFQAVFKYSFQIECFFW